MDMEETSRLKDLALSETGFVFDPRSGATFTVNQAGTCVLLALREGQGRADIVALLKERFLVGNADVESDLGDFLRLLVQHGILSPNFVLAPGKNPAGERAP
jgi:hypothetical protein